MASELYKKPIMFAIVATVVILVGTAVTMFLPMFTDQMHPKLENLKPFTPLELAGRDIYQREGCNNCHTQTVRPLRTEVMRYGDYSKAGEFAYDRPFLWGSKRTGPDLARIGGKYPDQWHYRHFENPRDFFAESNMPAYGWLKEAKLDKASVEGHMKAFGLPYGKGDIDALDGKNELDALVAYMQVIGAAVTQTAKAEAATKAPLAGVEEKNPFADDKAAIARGKELFEANCVFCHGAGGKGDIGPNLTDKTFLYLDKDVGDDDYFEIINNGTQAGTVEEGRTAKGGMPSFGKSLDKDKIWSLVAYIRSLQQGK